MNTYKTHCYFHSFHELPEVIGIDDSNTIILHNYQNHCEEMHRSVNKGFIYGIEIIAPDIEYAKTIVDLICSSHTVVAGFNYENPEEIITRLKNCNTENAMKVGALGAVYDNDELYFACLIVKKAFKSQYEKNAICKYHVAHEVYMLHPLDLHPMEDPFKDNYLLTERVRIANVITACYSVLEEINVQIHASKEKPSVNKSGDDWNPVVKEDLISRLKKNYIDPKLEIPWLTRNGIIRPFKIKVVKNNGMCEWSDGELIKDFNINICDAILELSYIRSQLSAHFMNEKVLKLSIYDAYNAFSLARIILLKHFQIDLSEK